MTRISFSLAIHLGVNNVLYLRIWTIKPHISGFRSHIHYLAFLKASVFFFLRLKEWYLIEGSWGLPEILYTFETCIKILVYALSMSGMVDAIYIIYL